MKTRDLAALAAGLVLAVPGSAQADVFNGRIAFSSFRSDPSFRTGDIFSINNDGTDLRQLTTNLADDAQSDWAPDGRDIVYRIRKPNSRINFEVSRMTASGQVVTPPLTDSPPGVASSQPTWYPDRSAILYRRSGGTEGPGSIWHMGPLGELPELLFDPPGAQLYPSWSPDMSRLLFATRKSEIGDTDRAVESMAADGTGLTTLFDVPGAYDSAPASSPDGTRIAFESNSDVAGGNPEGDLEIWMMDADGSDPIQITHNALHDEGPAWSPDGSMLAYSSGPENLQLDINVMTTEGVHLRTLTDFAGRDESPDWQPIPAPDTDRRCGDIADGGPLDVRAAGRGLRCRKARRLARAWWRQDRLGRYDVATEDFGGIERVILTRRGRHHRVKLVAFLFQPAA
jgi:Tol biopolymer transport system component